MITVNEKTMEWVKGMTIEDLLEKLAFDYPQTIVSVNDQRISPDIYHAYTIEDHANIKVVYLCHGG
jgi:thiamine biosynthesis protein ThiS